MRKPARKMNEKKAKKRLGEIYDLRVQLHDEANDLLWRLLDLYLVKNPQIKRRSTAIRRFAVLKALFNAGRFSEKKTASPPTA